MVNMPPMPMMVARSSSRNQLAASLVPEFRKSGCATARPMVMISVQRVVLVKMPRSRPKTAIMTAPRLTDFLKPQVSIAQEAGIDSGM